MQRCFLKLSGMEWCFMKKLDNYSRCLDVLRRAELSRACEDEIYRMGLIGQFHLSFELA